MVEQSLTICTSYGPVIGYDAAAALAKEAFAQGKTIRQVELEKKILSEDRLNALLDPRGMTEPGAETATSG